MDKTTTLSTARPWRLAWSVVFAVNLGFPLFFGWSMTRESGRIGMMVAIGLFWFLGHLACARSQRLGFILAVGGSIVGLSQAWPLLQIFAGFLSLGFVAMLGQTSAAAHDMDQINSELGGFLATMLTGGLLLTVALVCGSIAYAIFGPAFEDQKPGPPPSGPGIYDRQLDA